MRLHLTALFLLLALYPVFSQQYKWTSSLDSVIDDGFYRIQLPPAVTSRLKPDLSDIRILNKQKKEVPYIIQTEQPTSETILFREYKILSIEKGKKQTTLILQNPDRSKINNIHLVIKNADVDKTLRLSGSNDRKEWYVIRDRYLISDVYSQTETSAIKIFDFPLSDYQYFKINISDSLSPPLNILRAGYYDVYRENAKYSETLTPLVTQRDSSETKTTWVRISFPEPQLINKIDFTIIGPRYYMRHCELGIITDKSLQNKKTEKIFTPIKQFSFSSNGMNSLQLNDFRATEYFIKIENNDNPPLQLESVKCSQINHSLLSWLKKEGNYSIAFGNQKVVSPNYDLVNFKDSIDNVVVLHPGPIISIGDEKPLEAKAEIGIFNSSTFIWIALAVVVAVLGFMSVKMLRETRR